MSGPLPLLVHFALFTGLMTLAMRRDGANLVIPNRLTGAMALLGPVSLVLLGPAPWLPGTIVTAAGLLAAGWALMALGLWGGGDAKLIAAAALWMGPAASLAMVTLTLLAGALLGLALLASALCASARAVPGARLRPRLLARRLSLPFALAIGPAGIIALALETGTQF